jgi:hypothetical protein
MKIYVVSHYYNNGESYEDYREYENHEFYSTLKKAIKAFWDHVTVDYEGKFVLSVKTLDTQEGQKLEESAWVNCTPYYPDEEWQGDPDYDDYNCEYTGPDPLASIEEYWEWERECGCHPEDNISEEEDKAWFEYVTTPGTNYREWEEVNEDIKKRKQAMQFESLNEMLEELLKQ